MGRSDGAGTQCVLDGVPPTGGEGCFRSSNLAKINKSNSRGQFVNYTDVLLINWRCRVTVSLAIFGFVGQILQNKGLSTISRHAGD